ncbi:hypothetical protein BD413DRAFT_612839 [Trametes elegans]|nr:hypothetical protein BD413DRAFT_612839 [Trametes elegans]
MSNSRTVRILNPRAGGLLGDGSGLLGGGNLLGDPLSDLPGLSGITSALSPILTPIGLPGPGQSSTEETTTTAAATTSTSTSATSTISLTTSTSATSTSATTSATRATTTSTSTTSATTSSTSATETSSSTSAQSTATDSATTTSALPTSAAAVSQPPSSTDSSTSASSSATLAADHAKPNGFLANKALSVGVITAASLVGLVLIIAFATWAIRKRRNERLHQDIIDFSTAGLVNDEEKAGGAARRDWLADSGLDNSSSNGHGSSSSGHGGMSQPPVQSRNMYDNGGYPTLPVFVPNPTPSRAANSYPAQAAYADRYAFPSQEQNTTYANWGYGYGNNASAAAASQRQNTYEQAYGGMDDAYGGMAPPSPQQGAMAGIGAGAQSQGQAPQRRPSGHRKPPPQLTIAPSNPIAQAISEHTEGPIAVAQPQPARRTSLLNSPTASGGEGALRRERRDTLTHVELLDPSAPKAPTASPPLPDEFGTGAPPASKDSPSDQPVRRLVVRNE